MGVHLGLFLCMIAQLTQFATPVLLDTFGDNVVMILIMAALNLAVATFHLNNGIRRLIVRKRQAYVCSLIVGMWMCYEVVTHTNYLASPMVVLTTVMTILLPLRKIQQYVSKVDSATREYMRGHGEEEINHWEDDLP